LIDDEPNKTFSNPKWSGFFLESFKGQILLKIKVKWLDLVTHLSLPLFELSLAEMICVHYDYMVKYSKPCLSSSSKIIIGSSNICIMIMVMFTILALFKYVI
jgi:hypothetical protein